MGRKFVHNFGPTLVFLIALIVMELRYTCLSFATGGFFCVLMSYACILLQAFGFIVGACVVLAVSVFLIITTLSV